MATAYPDLVMQDAASGTGNGIPVGFGRPLRFATGATSVNQDGFNQKFKVRIQLRDTATGTATCTVIIEDSNDNSTYATLATVIATMVSGGPLAVGHARLFSTKKRYIRARISALSGGTAPTVYVYCMLGGGGV